jgi:EmrB/QacA subfamily drug resistance transporter
MQCKITEDNRKWWILAAMTGSLSMIMIDQTVVSVALPRMQADLGMTTTGAQWVVNSFMLSLASFLAVGGRLGDTLGRPRAFIAGVALFALASAVCGLAETQTQIVCGRVLQGMGAALMQPASAAMVIGAFHPSERGRAMALYAGISMGLMAMGPLIGGLLTQYLSWRYAFHINQPVAVWAIVMTCVAKPADRPDPQTINWPNLGIFLLGLPCVVLAMQQGNDWGWTSAPVAAAGGWGLALSVIFIVRERRSAAPLLRLSLFRDRAFAAETFLLASIQGAMTSNVVFGSIFLQRVLGFSPSRAGASLLCLITPVLVMAQLSGRYYDKHGVRTPAVTGAGLIFASMAYQSLALRFSQFAWIVPGLVLFGIGIGCIMTPVNTDALSRAPNLARGQASGLIQTTRQVGGSMGLAAFGALFGCFAGNDLRLGPALLNGLSAGYALAALFVLAGFAAALKWMPPGRPEHK